MQIIPVYQTSQGVFKTRWEASLKRNRKEVSPGTWEPIVDRFAILTEGDDKVRFHLLVTEEFVPSS